MTQLFTNNADTTLASGITNVATSLTVNTGDGAKFPTISGSDHFYVTLYKVSGVTEYNWEIVKVTGRVGDVFTVVRAQDGTSASAFNAGDKVSLRMTAAGAAAMAQKASNLSDLANAATARTNLGLGTAATTDATAYATAAQGTKADGAAQKANNLSDLANAATARTNLGLGTAAVAAASSFAAVANNLSDLASASTARTNLGLGTAAVAALTSLLQASNNLSDLANVGTARTNLGLGTMATQNASAVALTGSMSMTGVTLRFLADFSDATFSQRMLFQSSVVNGSTSVGAIPNGSGAFSQFLCFSGSDPDNASIGYIAQVGTTTRIASATTGTGTQGNISFLFGSTEFIRYDSGKYVVTKGNGGDTIPALGTTIVTGEIHAANAADNSDYGFMRLSAGGGTALTTRAAIDIQGYGATENSQIRFYTTGSERLRIDPSGSVRHAGLIGMQAAVLKGPLSGSVTVDWNSGNFQHMTLTGNTTLTFTKPQNDGAYKMQILIGQDSTGGRTLGYATTVNWAGGSAPAIGSTANQVTIFTFYCIVSSGIASYYGAGVTF